MLGTTIASGRLTLVIIAALAEFDSDLNVERTRADITAVTASSWLGRVVLNGFLNTFQQGIET